MFFVSRLQSFTIPCQHYTTSPRIPEAGQISTYLFVHEDVDEGVDDGTALGQDGWYHTGNGGDNAWTAKRGHHGHHPIRHPAEKVEHHGGDHHDEDVVLSAPGRRLPEPSDLKQESKC